MVEQAKPKMLANAHSAHVMLTLVDDEPAVLDVLGRAARLWQYPCQAACSAQAALRLLEGSSTPVVVTDLNMPGADGFWLLREIHKRWPGTFVIVLTGAIDLDAAVCCLNAGAYRYLLKPVCLDEFRHGLEAAFRAFELQRERDHQQERLERAVRYQARRVRRTFLAGIESLARMLEARDPYTAGHSIRVRRYSLGLARILGLESVQLRQLSLAAKLHDIGKVGVPEAVLNKKGRLTEDELRTVREHPGIGQRILRPFIREREVLAAVRSHHERFDGNGYPDGLAGGDIPLLARILSVADCFDAMTTARAYRGPLPVEEVLGFLGAGAGTQFDPELVLAFINNIRTQAEAAHHRQPKETLAVPLRGKSGTVSR